MLEVFSIAAALSVVGAAGYLLRAYRQRQLRRYWAPLELTPVAGWLEAAEGTYRERRLRLVVHPRHTELWVACRGKDKALYLDHLTPRQQAWMGGGRRDRTGKRVPIYGDMVLRGRPEALVDAVMGDEAVWDALRREVVPNLAEIEAGRALELRRNWLVVQLAPSVPTWGKSPDPFYRVVAAVGQLAARVEAVELPVALPTTVEVPVDEP